MALDQSTTSLINRSLRLLGERAIMNPNNPETPAGRILVDAYDQCRKEVLRRCPSTFAEFWGFWNYAGPTPGTPPPSPPVPGVGTYNMNQPQFDYQDSYVMPDNYIRMINIPGLASLSSVNRSGGTLVDYRFLNAGPPSYQRLIALDNNHAPTLAVSYVIDVPVLSRWDALTLKVLATWLALDQAKAITGQEAITKALSDMLTVDLQDAIGVSGNEQPKHESRFSKIARDREDAFLGNVSWFTPVQGYTADPG
jgi:hypothetical protein